MGKCTCNSGHCLVVAIAESRNAHEFKLCPTTYSTSASLSSLQSLHSGRLGSSPNPYYVRLYQLPALISLFPAFYAVARLIWLGVFQLRSSDPRKTIPTFTSLEKPQHISVFFHVYCLYMVCSHLRKHVSDVRFLYTYKFTIGTFSGFRGTT